MKKLGVLQEFYDNEKLSGKQYEYLRAILKIDPVELKDKNKKIVKRINDLLSGNISIPTFLEDLNGLEPELFGIAGKKRQEQERLRRQKEEEERNQREKAAIEAQLNAQEMANRLEQERLQRQREEEERAQREREEEEHIAEEKEQERIHREEKGPSYNKLLAMASVLGILLLGYWMIVQGLNNSSKIPDKTQSIPTAVVTTAYPITTTPIPTAQPTITQPAQTQTPEASPTQKLTAQPVTIILTNFAFVPEKLTILKGTTVVWTQEDSGISHTVTGTGFDSGSLSKGQTFSKLFNDAGIFNYGCSIHPSMRGTIIVQ